jgi:starch-binding outer membrane protein, SusD/RagB family
MKRLHKAIYFLILGVTLSACEKELELSNPNKFTTDLFWKTDNDFLSGLAATYKTFGSPWGGGYWNNKGIELQNCRGDDMFMRNDVAEWYRLQSFQNDASTPICGIIFQRLYMAIFRANQIIENVQDASISEASKSQYLAEAKFLRGLNYFYLVINYGAVPLRTEVPGERNEYYLKSSTEEEVWQQVIKDFQDAKAGLPVEYSAENAGRATKGAATGFLGKAYFYRGEWAKSETEFAELMSAPYTYDLLSNYGDNFRPEYDNNVESLFEFQFQNVGGLTNWANDGTAQSLGSVTAKELGPTEVQGWFELYPTNKIFNEFQKEKTTDGDFDPRMYASLVWQGVDANGDSLTYYQKVYNTKNFPNEYGFYSRIRKYQNWWAADEAVSVGGPGADGISEIDEKCLRFADILLMQAEALTMQGKVTDAYSYINRVRARAKLSALTNGFSQDQMMSEIKHQRMIEFYREGQRFYDLRRWGMLAQELKNSDKENADNFEPKFAYLPLPQAELDANPNLEQNPDWK